MVEQVASLIPMLVNIDARSALERLRDDGHRRVAALRREESRVAPADYPFSL